MEQLKILPEEFATDLSILVVTWNTRELLLRCVDSVGRETLHLDAEVLVVDNASSDGSAEAVAKCFPTVKLLRNSENFGFAKANNIGIRHCKGKYICFVNSDIVVGHRCIERLYTYMEENSTVGIVGPRILNPDRTVQISYRNLPTLWSALLRASGLDSSLLRKGYEECTETAPNARDIHILTGCFWMVRSEAIRQVGLLDEMYFMYGEDRDWCKRFADEGWRVVYLPSAEAMHHSGASSSADPIRFYIEMARSDLSYWKKHHGRASQVLYTGIVFFHEIVRIIRACLLYVLRPSGKDETTQKLRRSVRCALWLVQNGLHGFQ